MARQHENLCTVGSGSLSPAATKIEEHHFRANAERCRGVWASAGTDSSIYLQIIAAECYRSSAFDRHSRTPFIDSRIKRITTYLFTREREISSRAESVRHFTMTDWYRIIKRTTTRSIISMKLFDQKSTIYTYVQYILTCLMHIQYIDVDNASHVRSTNFTLCFYAVSATISEHATRESLYRKYFELKQQVV